MESTCFSVILVVCGGGGHRERVASSSAHDITGICFWFDSNLYKCEIIICYLNFCIRLRMRHRDTERERDDSRQTLALNQEVSPCRDGFK